MEGRKMTIMKKSVDLPTKLTAELLIRGAFTLEQGECEKVLSLLKKGLEKLIAQKVVSNRVAKQFKQLKTKTKEKTMRRGKDVNGDCALTGELVEVSVNVNNQPFGTRFFWPKDISDVQGHTTSADKYYRFMEAKMGATYGITIKLLDHTKRYLIGIAVDGRCVCSGKVVGNNIERSNSWDSGGSYVFDVGSENGGTITGWRESQNHVREFVFTSPENSFAGKWDDFSAIGTIAIAVFREDIPEPAQYDGSRSGGTRSIGTGYGNRVESRVGTTSFISKTVAYETFTINYQTTEVLKKLGVWTPEDLKAAPNRMWPATPPREFCNFPE